MMPDGELRNPEYASVVNAYLERLGWTQRDLADAMKASKSQVSGWLGKGLGRGIGRDDVCWMAWAIAGGLDGTMPQSKESPHGEQNAGRAELDYHLNRLLDAAGY